MVERAALVVVEAAEGDLAAGVPVPEVRHRHEDLATGLQVVAEALEQPLRVHDVLEDVAGDDHVVRRGAGGQAEADVGVDEAVEPLADAVRA